jgi:hypothetical protein
VVDGSTGDHTLVDQPVEEPWTEKRNEPGNGSAVVGDHDLGTSADLVDVPPQMVSQLADPNFHA